jgi:hypothetical protein
MEFTAGNFNRQDVPGILGGRDKEAAEAAESLIFSYFLLLL